MTEPTIPKHGGARPGSGRPPGTWSKHPDVAAFDAARARREIANAARAEIKLEQERGALIDCESVRQASAVLLATLCQGLRSLPDNLERKFALSGDVAESIAIAIDEALQEVAAGLRKLTEPPPAPTEH
jgi:hypothetical protein